MSEISKRWDKKERNIKNVSSEIQSLRNSITRDLSSNDEKEFLTALVIAIMDETAERVGNESSAENGRIGVTGLMKKNVTISGNQVTLKYTGKSGVNHTKTFSDSKIANSLKKAINNSPSEYVFTTSDGFKIKADRVNRYLNEFDISAKDIRGYSANKWIIDRLKNIDAEETETKRKTQFNKVVSSVSEKIGHGRATLKNHYMFSSIEENFVENGKVSSIDNLKNKEEYKQGGLVKTFTYEIGGL